ncbi:MAG: 16S rRNA (cytidine(1402)-2'-O)-methyltransferase [Aquabacterium sp.]
MDSATTSLLQQAAAAAAGAQQYPTGALYLVATPIGNLADITLRALHLLALADAVACEDTRVGGALLAHYGLRKPLMALHAHNEVEASLRVIERLTRGERVAYASDAGTPAVSDPGAALVAAVVAAGHRVVPLPGTSSVLAALSASGDSSGAAFTFNGFLPAKGATREAALVALLAAPGTQVLFEAPHRIEALIGSLAAAAPQRRLTLCRELTKQFETVHTFLAGQAPAWLAADPDRRRGEFVLVLHASPAVVDADEPTLAAQRVLRRLMQDLPLTQAVALAADLTGVPRKRLYRQALDWRDAAPGSDITPTGEPSG